MRASTVGAVSSRLHVVSLVVGVEGPPTPADGFEEAAAEHTTVCGSARSLSTTPSAPRRRGDPMRASTVGTVSTRLHVVSLVVGVEGPPTPADGFEEAYGPLIGDMAHTTGSGSKAAFCLPTVVDGLVATAAAAAGGQGGRWASSDWYPYDLSHATSRPSILVLATTRPLAEIKEVAEFSHQNLLRSVLARVGTPVYSQECLFYTAKSSKLSHEVIKYLVMDEADADWILDEHAIRKIAGGTDILWKSPRQTLTFFATFPPELQEVNSLIYWLYFKPLPTTVIHAGRNEERGVDGHAAISGNFMGDMVERSRVSDRAIRYLVMDEADCMLDMGCERQRNDLPHRSISSLRRLVNFCFFVFVLFSLLTSAVSVDSNFNITPKMDDFQGYCPAPPFQSKFVHSSILDPTPTPTPNIVHLSRLSLITVLGSILSLLSNCGLMLLIDNVETVGDSRRKWVGFSSVFFTAAYLLWILHLYQAEASDICQVICSLMLLVLHLSYLFIFWNMQWKMRTIVIGSISVCLLGGISARSAGISAIIFMISGHASRLWSAHNDLNWTSLACVFIGVFGGLLQSTTTSQSFDQMTLYQVGSWVVLTVRVFEVFIHIRDISTEGWDKFFPPEWRRKLPQWPIEFC